MKSKAKADLVKNMVRSVFVAPEGKQFYVADFASIEARTCMWYAQEEEALSAFRNKEDIYCQMAGKIYKYECNKEDNPKERFIGKTTILGCSYGMGVKTFFSMNEEVLDDVDHAKKCITAYREGYPGVKAMWKTVGFKFKNAMAGKTEKWMGCTFRFEVVANRACVTIEIPSGRKIFYYEPKIVMEWNEDFGCEVDQVYVKIRTDGGMNFRRTWGGDIFQDINQATARDLCVYGTREIEKRGFEPVISVHDEVCAIGDKDMSLENFEEGFACKPDWAKTIPVDVEGWVGPYYRK